MKCELLDVFTNEKLKGNGLTIFYDFQKLSSSQMLAYTQEMKQFESIFLSQHNKRFSARIFTVEEELDFAGHPLIGLAYHLHEHYGKEAEHEWEVELNSKTVRLTSSWKNSEFKGTMNQGRPIFGKSLSKEEAQIFYSALNLEPCSYPAEQISTGLPYIILPVRGGLDDIKFSVPDLTPLLNIHGAMFLYVLDIDRCEGRTWDNAGKVEDIATGSAAGPSAAYLYKHKICNDPEITIHQGRFTGRPSQISVKLVCKGNDIIDVLVSGNVIKIADITFTP